MLLTRSLWRAATRPTLAAARPVSLRSRGVDKAPGKLILVRHGESTWNAAKLFTGWVDVDLTEQGREEMDHAARLLLERGYRVDVVYTSVLKRAVSSTMILLAELRQSFRPVHKDWRLNERHYGALQGLSKTKLAESLGDEAAARVRSSFEARPPGLPEEHTLSPRRERKYSKVPAEQLPLAESLRDCLDRVRPLWKEKIYQDLVAGHDVLVVAHGNSLRGLVKEIDGISDARIEDVKIPNAIPLVYEFAKTPSGLEVLARDGETQEHCRGVFLEEKGLLRAALDRETMRREGAEEGTESVLSPLERSLTTLESRRRLFAGASEEAPAEARAVLATRRLRRKRRSIRPAKDGEPEPPPILVIIRHGKTEHNKLGLFTGWEDAPLAPEGRAEASAAGALMAAHGIKLDVVYTSWLSRAIETAWLALAPLDMVWLPIIKTWRLNERMYGALTGLSKKMVQQRHGDAQFKRWRRGYDEKPPAVSPFSPHYPGNDDRYVQYLHDLPVSYLQSLIRSLAHGRLETHHALPTTESLKDCMERTVPYYVSTIEPRSLSKGENVMIASSENAIRGLLMHLCEIPEENVPDIEIPTGVPLLFDFEQKCVRLLDDEATPQPRERYNFGVGGDLLFTPRGQRGGPIPDPHIYLDDHFVVPEEEAACELEVAADLEAVKLVEEFAGRKLPVEDVDFDPTCTVERDK